MWDVYRDRSIKQIREMIGKNYKMLPNFHPDGRFCCSLLMVISVLFFFSCSARFPAEEAFQKGMLSERTGRYDAAIAAYAKSFHIDFNYTKKFFKRGLHHKNLIYISTIVSNYIDIMRLNQIRVFGYDDENFLHYYENSKRAIRQLTESIRTNPRSARLYLGRGTTYYLNGDFDKAIADFTEAIELDSSSADVYYRRSLSYYAKADIGHVISDSTRAIELNDMYAYAYYVRGTAHAFYNQPDKAVEDFSRAIESYRNFDDAYYRRGQICYELVRQKKQEKIESAIFDYDAAIKINPENPNYYFSRGMAYLSYMDNYDHAIADFTKVIEILPHYGTAYYNRAKAYFGKKEYGKSWEDIRKAEASGFGPDAHFLGQLQKASGRVK